MHPNSVQHRDGKISTRSGFRGRKEIVIRLKGTLRHVVAQEKHVNYFYRETRSSKNSDGSITCIQIVRGQEKLVTIRGRKKTEPTLPERTKWQNNVANK